MATLPAAPPAFLFAHRAELEAALQRQVGDSPDPLAVAARYVMGWEDADGRPIAGGGKRIRPLLCLLAAETFGGSVADALPGAVAVELVHNFSLVHDDVQDRDAERHGRPAAWKLHGEAQAINLGDYLYTRALGALTEGPGPGERRLAALSVLLAATGRMIAGQWQDISFESQAAVTVEGYMAMVAGKTGALLGAPLAMGALLAGASAAEASIVGRWGEEVGIAFQAQDDYLGAWGDPGVTGKSNSNDLARKKKSLPVVLGLLDSRAAAVISRVYAVAEPSPDEVREVLAALEAAGCDSACRELAARHAAAAADILAGLDLPAAARDRFGEVAAYLVARSS